MFKNRYIHTFKWLLFSLLIVLFTACSSSTGEDGVGDGPVHKPTLLTIYVYSPEAATANWRSASTRAETGNVNPIGNEAAIHNLQIWIYESESKEFVGYLSTEEVTSLNMSDGATYQLPVSDDFAQRKPSVNVYVLANGTLNEETNHEALMDGAKIVDHFGLGNLVMSVPDQGLPMAGKLTVQPVVGDAPALRVGTRYHESGVYCTFDKSCFETSFRLCQDYWTANGEYQKHQDEYWHDTRRGVSLQDTDIYDL